MYILWNIDVPTDNIINKLAEDQVDKKKQKQRQIDEWMDKKLVGKVTIEKFQTVFYVFS